MVGKTLAELALSVDSAEEVVNILVPHYCSWSMSVNL